MILRRRKSPKMNVKEAPQIRCAAHLRWVRGFECLIAHRTGHTCFGKMQAHHVRKGTHTGMSETPDDSEVVPLCLLAHDEVHRGHDTFEAKYGLNLSKIAAELWAKSPHGQRFRSAHDVREME